MRTYALVATLVACLFGLLIAGCAQVDPQLQLAMSHRSVTSIEVELAPELQRGLLPWMTELSDEQKVQLVRERVKGSLASRIVSLPQGREPTILAVKITAIAIPDAYARTVGAMSGLNGTAKLLDEKSRTAVGGNLSPVQVIDGGFAGNGLIGMLTVAAVNAVKSATEDKLNTLSEAFAIMLVGQLASVTG